MVLGTKQLGCAAKRPRVKIEGNDFGENDLWGNGLRGETSCYPIESLYLSSDTAYALASIWQGLRVSVINENKDKRMTVRLFQDESLKSPQRRIQDMI